VPTKVLIDTSAFYAIIAVSDEFHSKARELYERLIDRDNELYTTSYVLVETAALVHHRLGFQPLKTLMESIERTVRTYWVSSDLHKEAWKMMVARDGARLTFVDCSTIVTAKKLNASVFAFDEDFELEGLTVLPR